MMKRILHVLNGLGSGGAESFIMNVYRNIDREKIQFDFLLRTSNNSSALIKEAEKLGANIYILSSFPRHVFKNYLEVKAFFKNHKYEVIHVHANALIYITPLIIGRKYHVAKRILHSHSTNTRWGIFSNLIHYWNRNFVGALANQYFACSNEAGKWMFKERNFLVLNNAIDVERYVYNYEIRKSVREKLGIDDKIVFGHIGRFAQVKNHEFLLEVFKKIVEKKSNAILMLVGVGELLNQIKECAKKLNLYQKVLFMGERNDVSDLLQAMDGFIFPSIYEGVPFTLIEAQASGLPILASNTISRNVKITDCIEFFPLNIEPVEWANKAISMVKEQKRRNTKDMIKDAHYDINETINKLMNCYNK